VPVNEGSQPAAVVRANLQNPRLTFKTPPFPASRKPKTVEFCPFATSRMTGTAARTTGPTSRMDGINWRGRGNGLPAAGSQPRMTGTFREGWFSSAEGGARNAEHADRAGIAWTGLQLAGSHSRMTGKGCGMGDFNCGMRNTECGCCDFNCEMGSAECGMSDSVCGGLVQKRGRRVRPHGISGIDSKHYEIFQK